MVLWCDDDDDDDNDDDGDGSDGSDNEDVDDYDAGDCSYYNGDDDANKASTCTVDVYVWTYVCSWWMWLVCVYIQVYNN